MFATLPAFPCSFRVKLLQGIQIFDRPLLDRVCACVWKIDCPRDTGAVVVVWYDARRITIPKGESCARAARIISAARLIDWLRHAADAAGSGGRRNDQDLETEERGDDFFSSTFHCCADYSSSRQRECDRSAPHNQKRVQSFPGYGGRLWYVQVVVFSPAPAPSNMSLNLSWIFVTAVEVGQNSRISFFFRRLVTLAHTKLERVERLPFGLGPKLCIGSLQL